MDLSKLSIPDSITVHITFPGMGKLYDDDGKTKPTTINLLSPASDEVIAYKHKLQHKLSMRIGKRGMKAMVIDPDESDQNEVDRLVVFTASVNNLTYMDEKITADTIGKVYADPKMGWLCDQLNEKLGSWDDFLA